MRCTQCGLALEAGAMGHPLQAADAYADAAWLAVRAGGAGEDWSARATILYAACSAVPLLGAVVAAASPAAASPAHGV